MTGDAPRPEPADGIAMIGGGRMASALAEGFCRAGLLSPAAIVVHDPAAAAREALAARLPGVRFAATAAEAAASAPLVWLAVKPQQAAEACGGIAAVMEGRTLVSILAGLSTATLADLANTPRVIRVMPNTPCLVGKGVSVICRTAAVPADVAERVSDLLAAVGSVHDADESLMNAVTAVSGSGPGFLARIVEAIAAGGERAGLPRPLATALAVETLAGTGRLLEETGEDPAVIRERVSSPGGTTLAGLGVMAERGVAEALAAAVLAATARASELGR
jgi:pyrroline-5-carboxylate reductase